MDGRTNSGKEDERLNWGIFKDTSYLATNVKKKDSKNSNKII